VTAGSTNSVAAANVATSDIIDWTPQVSLQGVTGYSVSTGGALSIDTYPTAGYINVNVCNWTAGSITPGVLTLNVRVIR
jgi:S-adenosylmethionine/arginine decarboxylase-like enzyme